jgi:hypothetical protein
MSFIAVNCRSRLSVSGHHAQPFRDCRLMQGIRTHLDRRGDLLKPKHCTYRGREVRTPPLYRYSNVLVSSDIVGLPAPHASPHPQLNKSPWTPQRHNLLGLSTQSALFIPRFNLQKIRQKETKFSAMLHLSRQKPQPNMSFSLFPSRKDDPPPVPPKTEYPVPRSASSLGENPGNKDRSVSEN